jgi:AbiU2
MEFSDPKITTLREMVTAAQQELEYAIQFHEVWKIAADDSDLHNRMGKSYASQAFLIMRTALRREMLLALMRLWDTNREAIRMTWIVATLREKGVVDVLAANRVRGSWPGALEMMTAELNKQAAEVFLVANKYMEGGSHKAALEGLKNLRHERLAHRQLAPATVKGENAPDEKEIEEFYQDTAKLVQVLSTLVNAMAYDPEQSVEVYRHYAKFFWAAARGERTEGHPDYRPRLPRVGA